MAFGDGILSSFDSGFTLGNLMREKKRKDAIRNAFAKAYTPGSVETVPFIAPEEAEFGLPPIQGLTTENVKPASVDYKNAIAELVKGGYGEEAFELENKMQQNELARLLTGAKVSDALRRKPPTTRSFPINTQGDLRTEEFDETTGTWREVAVGRKSPLVQNNIGDKAATAGAVELAKEDAKRLTKADEDAALARTGIAGMERMKEILTAPGMRTGTGAGAESAIAGGIQSFTGIDPTKIGLIDPALADEFKALSNQAVLVGRRVMQMPASGFSDADRQFLEKANPGLGMRPEANERLIKLGYLSSHYLNERQKLMDEQLRNQGNLKGFEVKFADYWMKRKKELENQFAPSPKGAIGSPQTSSKPSHKLGDIVTGKDGKRYRIVKLNPDGDHDIAPVQ